MKKILNVISSPKGAASYSIRLAQGVIDKLQTAYPGSTVKTFNLIEQQFPHLDESHLTSFWTPSAQHSEKDKAAIRHSDAAIHDIMEADILVIGAPMYNFSIHSSLKAWIDHIVRSGVTFSYSEKGLEGLVKGKKAYLVITTGMVYPDAASKTNDHVESYMKWMLSFIGLSDITVVRAEGTAMPDLKDTTLETAISAINVD